MNVAELRALVELTNARFEAERARLRGFFEVEAGLRRDLARLEAHGRAMAALPPDDLGQGRAIGADIAWSAWQAKKRMEVNRDLALHLARKEGVLKALRRAYGKKEAANTLWKNARQAKAAACLAAQADITQQQAILVAHPRARPGTGSG